MNKKLLIVIDMQNDFIDGVLGTPEAQAIVPKVIDKIKNWEGMVCFTSDGHSAIEWRDFDGLENSEEAKRVPLHCEFGKKGEELQKDIKIWAEENKAKIWYKSKFSYDWYSDCYDYLFEWFDEIEIVGLCTDICVISNALVLRSVDDFMPITVDASCCAGTSPEAHKAALMVMKNCCINVINED